MSQTAAPRIGGGEVSTYVWGRADLYGRGWVARQQNLIPLIGGLYRRPGTKVLRCGAMDEHTYGAPCVLMSMAPYAATHGGTVGLHGGGLSIYYPYDPPPFLSYERVKMEGPGLYEGDYHNPMVPGNFVETTRLGVSMGSLSGALFDARMDYPSDYGEDPYIVEPSFCTAGVAMFSGGALFDARKDYPSDYGGPDYMREPTLARVSGFNFSSGRYERVLTWPSMLVQSPCKTGQASFVSGTYVIP